VSTQIPQDHALKLQLAAIGGNEPPSSLIEVRPLTTGEFRPDEGARCWMPVRDRREIAARISELAPEYHVYIGGAPRVREGGTADDVERVWSLWADCDSEESVAALRTFHPRPSVVVQTRSGRLQALWPMRQPIPPHWAKRANQRLAFALGSDRQAVDAARILRPIGSVNHKSAPASLVTCLRCELDVFLMEQVVGRLPDPAAYVAPPEVNNGSHDDYGSAALDGLVRTVAQAHEGNRNCALHWAACRVADHRRELDENEARAALREAGLAAGLRASEVEATLRSALDRRAAA
jgi:hypothetical protein